MTPQEKFNILTTSKDKQYEQAQFEFALLCAERTIDERTHIQIVDFFTLIAIMRISKNFKSIEHLKDGDYQASDLAAYRASYCASDLAAYRASYWASDRASNWASNRASNWASNWASYWASDWASYWASDRASDWASDWAAYWASEKEIQCQIAEYVWDKWGLDEKDSVKKHHGASRVDVGRRNKSQGLIELIARR